VENLSSFTITTTSQKQRWFEFLLPKRLFDILSKEKCAIIIIINELRFYKRILFDLNLLINILAYFLFFYYLFLFFLLIELIQGQVMRLGKKFFNICFLLLNICELS
jgi:hypothetical protein